MDVTDRIAVVTGAGRGIGRGIALVLAQNGADVAVADIELENAESVAEEVNALGRKSKGLFLDVTNQQSSEKLVEDVLTEFGRIDILVNNAGIIAAHGWEARRRDDDDDWDRIYEVNVRGIARMSDLVSGLMKEEGYGKIVNIASTAARQGGAGMGAYCSSKAAVVSITQSFALELAPYNINVNTVCPGLLWTPMWERIANRRASLLDNPENKSPRQLFDDYVEQSTPLKREQTPEDIGNAVAFFCSDVSKNITGQALNVCGGSYMN